MSKKAERKKQKQKKLKIGHRLIAQNPLFKLELKRLNRFDFWNELKEISYYWSLSAFDKIENSLKLFKDRDLFEINDKQKKLYTADNKVIKDERLDGVCVNNNIYIHIKPPLQVRNNIFGVVNLALLKNFIEKKEPNILKIFEQNKQKNYAYFKFMIFFNILERGKNEVTSVTRHSKLIYAKNMIELLSFFVNYMAPYYLEYTYFHEIIGVKVEIHQLKYK